MLLDLVEIQFNKNSTLFLLDIDHELTKTSIPKIQITSPFNKNFDGIYFPWKYTDYGYVWQKNIPNSSISFIFVWNKKLPNEPMFIYKYEPALVTTQLLLMAKATTVMRGRNPITKWSVQDPQTLVWNFIQNIFVKEINP